MKSRYELKQQAKAALSANYGRVLGGYLIAALLLMVVSSVTAGIAALILTGPITIALNWFYLHHFIGDPQPASAMGTVGCTNIGRKIGGFLWMVLFELLWSLLFFIPGWVKSYSYAMTPYILGDLPEIDARSALKLSMDMMRGHKMELFILQLSFFGWMLLSAMTAGILALFYVGPYMGLTMAGFYDEVKADAIARGILTPSASTL